MTSNMKSLSAPILIITVGVGWLLTIHDIVPGVNWVWTLGLAVAGLLILAIGGVDKVTFSACFLSHPRFSRSCGKPDAFASIRKCPRW